MLKRILLVFHIIYCLSTTQNIVSCTSLSSSEHPLKNVNTEQQYSNFSNDYAKSIGLDDFDAYEAWLEENFDSKFDSKFYNEFNDKMSKSTEETENELKELSTLLEMFKDYDDYSNINKNKNKVMPNFTFSNHSYPDIDTDELRGSAVMNFSYNINETIGKIRSIWEKMPRYNDWVWFSQSHKPNPELYKNITDPLSNYLPDNIHVQFTSNDTKM